MAKITSWLSLACGSSDANRFALSSYPAFKYKKHKVARMVDFCFSLMDMGRPRSINSIASSVLPFNAKVLAKPKIIPGLFG